MASAKSWIPVVAAMGIALSGCLPQELGSPLNSPAQTHHNTPPTISGSPATVVAAGSMYSFLPAASDLDGDSLSFSASGLPTWASFDSRTGLLSGRPTVADVGTTDEIVISVHDAEDAKALPGFHVQVTSAATANSPPVIGGAPPLTATAGTNFAFTPVASDPDGDQLGFVIANKPAWASFSTSSGALTGTAQAGTYTGISITVSDGQATRSLTFTLVVTAVQPAPTGSAVLSWNAPVRYVDGSALPASDLSGYRVYHGTNANSLDDVVEVAAMSASTYTFQQLAQGTHYFAVSAVTALGAESALTQVRTKTIP